MGFRVMDGEAVVVWWKDGALHSQAFSSVDEAEKMATTCGLWAVVVVGGEGEFGGSISINGDYPFPAFGGEV